MMRKLSLFFGLVKFEHTLFALPFAFISALVAGLGPSGPGLPARVIFWILVAMVGARSSALAFNRLVDANLDRQNPRTADRALVSGALRHPEVRVFTFACAGLLVLAAGMLNRLALALSPLALAVIWGYSYTKRFTTWSHLLLGLALGIAPVGAWIAVRGEFAWPPIILALAVTCWTAGFDIIYALQDLDFDRRLGLFSLPARFGARRALLISTGLHVLTLWLLVWFGSLASLGLLYYFGLLLAMGLIFYQHQIVRPDDFSRVNAAFFSANGALSLVLFFLTAADVIWKPRLFA
jgi:4-hydroxybenzoate polyprenyltransferase